ncbi:MAG TPA: hypothetical protein VH482_04070 [Thermomicrobiales bacterium]|jgi:hypothetical protein
MAPHTFLAPGQRYADIAADPWRVDQQLTILQIAPRPDDSPLVTYRCFNGDEESTTVSRFEAAITGGLIVPVIGTGRRAAAC